jgi:hypothetical protein
MVNMRDGSTDKNERKLQSEIMLFCLTNVPYLWKINFYSVISEF